MMRLPGAAGLSCSDWQSITLTAMFSTNTDLIYANNPIANTGNYVILWTYAQGADEFQSLRITACL
jgi:hypothetical protein